MAVRRVTLGEEAAQQVVGHASEPLGRDGRRIPNASAAAAAAPLGGGELGEQLLALCIPGVPPPRLRLHAFHRRSHLVTRQVRGVRVSEGCKGGARV